MGWALGRSMLGIPSISNSRLTVEGRRMWKEDEWYGSQLVELQEADTLV